MYRYCPICGRPLPSGLMSFGLHTCSDHALERIEKVRAEFEPDGVFDNCNVCGRKLHTVDEDKMGMCQPCADE